MNKIYLAAFLVLAIAFPALAVSTTTVTTTTVTTYEGVSDEAAQVTPESSEPLPPALTPVTYNGTTKSGQALYLDAGLGMGYYYLYPKDSQLQAFYKGGLNWRAFMEFKSDSGLSAAGEFGIFSEGNMSSLAPAGTALTIIPVTASIAYHFFKDSSIQPYLGGGVGIYFINESDPDYTYLSATKFGTHLMAGADVFFTPETFMFKREKIR